MLDVDFDQMAPQLICHPDLKKFENKILNGLKAFDLNDHFILFSSGTTSSLLKGYALSKVALFKNAKAVNAFFNLNSSDIWGLSLPIYHVGGLSVLARAHLLKNKLIDLRKWSPEKWMQNIAPVSITTIVPTQLYDLVKLNLKAPKNLKYLIVGGDYLSSKLKQRARELGWPVISTYGMSEVCSQLASTRSPESDELEILPIHQVKTIDSRLLVKSPSLFTLEFNLGDDFRVRQAKDLCDAEGFYLTNDRAQIIKNIIHPLGRMGDELKIAGHLVNINKLKDTLAGFLLEHNLYGQMEFSITEDERKGKKLLLLTLGSAHQRELIEEIKNRVKPVIIDEVRVLEHFNRTELGKLKKS